MMIGELAQLVKKFPNFHGNQMFITIFTRVHAVPDESRPYPHTILP